MGRTLTVFLCGTHRDLVTERGAVIQAIEQLRAEHDSMEFFGARPHPPLDTCLEEVRRSDVLVVVVGHRYGEFAPGLEMSYTEAEYTEGHALNKPCLVYLRDDSIPVLVENVERNPKGMEALIRFKQTLGERHTVATFRGAEDLAQQVQTDLERIFEAFASTADHTQPNAPGVSDVLQDLLRNALHAGVSETTLVAALRGAVAALLTPENQPASVFLSYSFSDREIVQRFAEGLTRRGINVWWDQERVLPGDSIITEVVSGLEQADVVAFFLSSHSIGRKWVQYELNFAIAHRLNAIGGAKILPIRLDEAPVPSVLRDVREIDLRSGNVEEAVDMTVRTIHQLQRTRQSRSD